MREMNKELDYNDFYDEEDGDYVEDEEERVFSEPIKTGWLGKQI